VFERYTKPKRATTKRLLIVDGHSSHINMAFVDWADSHGIILLVLPPHTTHRLQPLDVGLFQPLSTAYSKGLEKVMSSGGGQVSMSKALFYSIFQPAWEAAFTEDNIQHAWQKSGIWPLDSKRILSQVIRPPPISYIMDPTLLKTPRSSKSIRHFQKLYIQSPSSVKRHKLFKTNKTLAAELAILKHENRGLQYAIELQKKKGKKSKRLNLIGEDGGLPVCYSPATIVRARQLQEEKEAQETENIRQKAIRKQQRTEAAVEKAVAVQLRKDLRAQKKEEALALKKIRQIEARKAKKPNKVIKRARKSTNIITLLKEAPKKAEGINNTKEEGRVKTRTGRQITLPIRFQ
jgi:DDE superfamily endonuclease